MSVFVCDGGFFFGSAFSPQTFFALFFGGLLCLDWWSIFFWGLGGTFYWFCSVSGIIPCLYEPSTGGALVVLFNDEKSLIIWYFEVQKNDGQKYDVFCARHFTDGKSILMYFNRSTNWCIKSVCFTWNNTNHIHSRSPRITQDDPLEFPIVSHPIISPWQTGDNILRFSSQQNTMFLTFWKCAELPPPWFFDVLSQRWPWFSLFFSHFWRATDSRFLS